MKNRVVVTGMGAVSPVGNTLAENWANLLAGKSGAGYITKFDASAFPVQIDAEVKNLIPPIILIKEKSKNLTVLFFLP